MLSSRRIRRVLKGPDRPIAIRNEYIAERKTLLIVIPQEDAPSAAAARYDIVDEDGFPHFSVTSRKFNDRACREFRDASGLPLFELHRKISYRNAWKVTLPGCDTGKIGSGSLRWSFAGGRGIGSGGGNGTVGNFNFTFENAAAIGNKREEDKKITLEIERHGNALTTFDVVDGDRKVAMVTESIPHNKTLALMPMSRIGNRPVLDIVVTPGMDVSLATIIAVIASDSVFS